MHQRINSLIDVAITLEMNMAKLYLLFHDIFPEDCELWWTLSIEEKNHAALLKSGRDSFLPMDKFPQDLFDECLTDISETNRIAVCLLDEYNTSPGKREEALRAAIKLEKSAGESHFQRFMEKDSDSRIDEIFQRLNRDDKDHEKRIISYMKSICVCPPE